MSGGTTWEDLNEALDALDRAAKGYEGIKHRATLLRLAEEVKALLPAIAQEEKR